MVVRDHWRNTGSSGTGLYDFADRTARDMGWQLNLQLTGHRLGEFPHRAHDDGTPSRVGFRPSEGLWVLEIQIRHPTRDIGAFFEDLLLTDDDLQRLAFSGAPART